MDVGSNPAGKVNAPAIALIITAAIGILMNLYGVTTNLKAMGGGGADMQAIEQQLEEQFENMPEAEGMPQMDAQMFMKFFQGMGAMGLVFNVIALLVGALIIFAALKMRKLESRGLAVAASILAMIPCISPCCILGLPIGIWSLVALSNAEVKSAFS